jgi:hypothetical protein
MEPTPTKPTKRAKEADAHQALTGILDSALSNLPSPTPTSTPQLQPQPQTLPLSTLHPTVRRTIDTLSREIREHSQIKSEAEATQRALSATLTEYMDSHSLSLASIKDDRETRLWSSVSIREGADVRINADRLRDALVALNLPGLDLAAIQGVIDQSTKTTPWRVAVVNPVKATGGKK